MLAVGILSSEPDDCMQNAGLNSCKTRLYEFTATSYILKNVLLILFRLIVQ